MLTFKHSTVTILQIIINILVMCSKLVCMCALKKGCIIYQVIMGQALMNEHFKKLKVDISMHVCVCVCMPLIV